MQGTIKKIRNSLYQIHKCLMAHVPVAETLKRNKPLDANDFLQLSSLIIAIDERMEESEADIKSLYEPLIHEIESLFFSPMDKDISFYEKVSIVKETNPSLLMNLSELMQLLIEFVQQPTGNEVSSKLSSQIQI